MFSIAARLKMTSLANVGKLSAAPVMGMVTSTEPTTPKRPPTTYQLFTKENFAAEKARNPKARLGEIMKALGARWTKLADADKKVYLNKAAKLRAEYDCAMPTIPKPPVNVTSLFVEENFAAERARNPKAPTTEIFKALGAQWNKLDDTIKKVYADKVTKLKADWQSAIRKSPTCGRTAPVMDMGTSIGPAIPKRPLTAFALFTKENFAAEKARNPKAPSRETIKALAGQWNKLDDSDKEAYVDKAAKLWAEYDAQITDEQRKMQMRAYRLKREKKHDHRPVLLIHAPFSLFLLEGYNTLPAAEGNSVCSETTHQLAAEWHGLPDAFKSAYVAMMDTWMAAKNKK